MIKQILIEQKLWKMRFSRFKNNVWKLMCRNKYGIKISTGGEIAYRPYFVWTLLDSQIRANKVLPLKVLTEIFDGINYVENFRSVVILHLRSLWFKSFNSSIAMLSIARTGVSTPLDCYGDALTKGAPWTSKYYRPPPLQRRSHWEWSTPRFDINSAYLYWKGQ